MMSRCCPCCGSAEALKRFCDRFDAHGNEVFLRVCADCTAIVNGSQLDEAMSDRSAALAVQEEGSKSFYEVEPFLARKDADVAAMTEVIQFLFDRADAPIGRRRAIDLGAGFGHMAAAACHFFDETWALEINRWTLDQVVPHFAQGDKLRVGSDLAEVPGDADAVFMWHTLEHIPAAYEVGRAVANRLEPGGVLFWQVPLYRDPYVVYSHFTFFNAHSASVFHDRIGLKTENVWFDYDNQFMTVLGRKPF